MGLGIIPGLGSPLGMQSGFGIKPLDCTEVDSGWDSGNLTNYSFASKSLGAADSSRYIVVLIHKFTVTNSNPVTSVTVAGVAATKLASTFYWNIDQAAESSIWIAAVPTGTTGTIAVNSGYSNSNCGIRLFRLLGVNTTPVDTISSGAALNTVTDTIDVPIGGVVLAAMAMGQSGPAKRGGSFAWKAYDSGATGLTVSVATSDTTAASTWTGVTGLVDNNEGVASRTETSLTAVSLAPAA